MKSLILLALRFWLAVMSVAMAQAASITLAWDPSPSPNVNYVVYNSKNNAAYTIVGNNIAGLNYTYNYDDTVTNRWYVTAKDITTSLESVPSNIVIKYPTPITPPPVFGLSFEAEQGTITSPFYVNGSVVQQDTQTDVASSGRASYVFNVTNAGNYTISMLVNAPNEGANSFFVNIDAEPTDPANVWNIPVTTGIQARTVAIPYDATNATTFTLSAGNHTLIVRGREAGTQVDRITFTPISVTPPTGNLAMSTPTLNGTGFASGQTVTGTAYVTNKTTAPFQIMSGVITARAGSSGTPYNFVPAVASQTLAVNGVLTVNASWVVPGNAPAGSWTAFVAIQGTNGVWLNGPTTPFTIATPVVLAISKPTLNGTTFAIGSTITGTVYLTNNTGAPFQLADGVLTGRQPGANNQTGPYDDFTPVMTPQTMAVNQVLGLTASWVVRADAPIGTGWTAHLAARGTNLVWTDGPTTPFAVTPQPPSSPTNLRIQ